MSDRKSAVLVLAVLGAAACSSVHAAGGDVPRYQVDPWWPQMLPAA